MPKVDQINVCKAMVEVTDYARLDKIEELVRLVINHLDPDPPHRPAQVGKIRYSDENVGWMIILAESLCEVWYLYFAQIREHILYHKFHRMVFVYALYIFLFF